MEVEENNTLVVDNPLESNSKKGKILTLLFPAESHPAEGKENKKDKNKPPTKVVIRRLPPKLTKEGFLEEFSSLPSHDYFHFVRGDLNLGPYAFSRAYINFLNQEDIFLFKEKFDDYGIQDENGKTYHAVVEFAPFQKIPRRNVIKKKLLKAGKLESDPKYIEFLKKLEESKNFINNPSEYFHETENSALKSKVVTTPLLEFLKRKRQKKIDLKNEIRQRKREAEREKRKKEEERRKAERERRKEEKKSCEKSKILEEKGKKLEERVKDKKSDDRGRSKEDKKELKNRKNLENDLGTEEQLNSVIPNDPAILKVVVRQPDKSTENDIKPGMKPAFSSNEELKSSKMNDSETGKPERKYSDFRTKLAEDKQRKTFYRRDSEDSKMVKTIRKGVPDEKGDNYNIGNCSEIKKTESESDQRVEVKETKSKFRYSEQRNRDREFRQKTSDCKNVKESSSNSGNVKNKSKDPAKVSELVEEEAKTGSALEAVDGEPGQKIEIPVRIRGKSLELERDVTGVERKRSKSFHDVSCKEFFWLFDKKNEGDRSRDVNTPENESVQTDDNSKESTESDKLDDDSKKDPRVERRIRNKDRPSIEIYRPGMGKFSKQRLEQKKDDSIGRNPYSGKSNRFSNKPNNKKMLTKASDNSFSDKASFKSDDSSHKNNGTNGKTQSEVRTMTFTRSTSKEN